MGTFYNDFEGYNVDDDDDEEDDDDEFLLVDDRNWRTFRKNLSMKEGKVKKPPLSVSVENEEVLESQSKELYKEYKQGIWAHETSTVRCAMTNAQNVGFPYFSFSKLFFFGPHLTHSTHLFAS